MVNSRGAKAEVVEAASIPVSVPAHSIISNGVNGLSSRRLDDDDDEVDYLGSITSSPAPNPRALSPPRTPPEAAPDIPIAWHEREKPISPSRQSTQEEGEIVAGSTAPNTRASTPSTSAPSGLSFPSRPPPSAPRSFKLGGLSPSHPPSLPFASRSAGGPLSLPQRPPLPPGLRPLPSGPRALRAAAAASSVSSPSLPVRTFGSVGVSGGGGFGFGGVPRGPSADRDRERERERDGKDRKDVGAVSRGRSTGGWSR